MNDVRNYIDKLFSKYPKTNETFELKEEVIGNLEAKIEDLQSNGVSFEEAFQSSIREMGELDTLIAGVKSIQMSKVLVETIQWTLIYTLLAWIMTIPLGMFDSARKTSWLLFVLVLVAGFLYFAVYFTQRLFKAKSMKVNLLKVMAVRKYVWAIWTLFILVQWGMVTALYFGSNIWFWRPISMNGPYEFGEMLIAYAIPAITIIVPLLVNQFKKVLEQQEEAIFDEA